MIHINHLARTTTDALEAIVRQRLGDLFPAAALAVIHRNELVFSGAWGWIDPDTATIPVTHESLFDLASITKLYTATAFLALMSDHNLPLDTPLVALIPEFGEVAPRSITGGKDPHTKQPLPTPPEMAHLQVDPAQVTVFHLLTHTSGLPPWSDVYNTTPTPPPPPTEPDPAGRHDRWQRAVERLVRYPFVAPPDGVVRYSDLGLMLLGEATARLHGGDPADLEAAIRQRVLKPLGVVNTLFNPVRDHGRRLEDTVPTEDDPGWRGRRVWGEVHDENACGVGGVAGHAGLFATAEDVAAFGRAWLYAPSGTFGILPHLARQAVQEHADTDDERRGLGWMLKSRENSSAGDRFSLHSYGHTGFTGTSLWIDPQAQIVVACLTNSVYPGRGKVGTHAFRREVHTLLYDALA